MRAQSCSPFPLPSSEEPRAMLLPSWSVSSQARALASIPHLCSVVGLVCLRRPSAYWSRSKAVCGEPKGKRLGYPQLAVAMYSVLLGPFLGWHEPASDRYNGGGVACSQYSVLICSTCLPNSAGHWLATGLLPFHLLPAQRLPIQRPSQRKQKRRRMGASASGCPPSGHCNV